MLKIWWICKIEIWSEELVDGHQTVPYQPGALCLVVFLTHFNPNFSLKYDFTPIHEYLHWMVFDFVFF